MPSFLRIIIVDYLASLGVIFPIVIWGLALVTRFFDPAAASFFLLIAPYVTIGGLAVLLWRAWLIRTVFAEGDEVPGVVVGISFFRGRGRITYVYTIHSKKYQSSNAIQASATTRAFAHGQTVSVMVHRLHPKRAFVRELYL